LIEQGEGFCDDTLRVCAWLAKRAEEVLGLVIQHKTNTLDGSSRLANDWRKVRTIIGIMDGDLKSNRGEADRFFI
jgi:hypothetical protein